MTPLATTTGVEPASFRLTTGRFTVQLRGQDSSIELFRVADGDRTRDLLIHIQVRYLLRHSHHASE